jgi:predicted DNA-binding transcriptional regulator AlpA
MIRKTIAGDEREPIQLKYAPGVLERAAIRRPGTAAALLTDIQTAEYLNVSAATLRRYRLLRTGPPYVKVGALVRYRLSDVDSWLDQLPKGGHRGSAV